MRKSKEYSSPVSGRPWSYSLKDFCQRGVSAVVRRQAAQALKPAHGVGVLLKAESVCQHVLGELCPRL